MNTVHFLLLKDEHGASILQKAEDISTVIAGWRPARAGRPAGPVCYLLLKNNNRIEVAGESVSTIWDKLEAVHGFRPVIVNAQGHVSEADAQPQHEEEAENG